MRFLASLFATALMLAAAEGPPVTKTMPVTETLHGITITDPYRWLEDQDSPETRAWLDRQNQYTQAYLTTIPGRWYRSMFYGDKQVMQNFSADEASQAAPKVQF